MAVLPVYNLILLPNVTFFFKKDVYEHTPGIQIHQGAELLFLMMKEDRIKDEVSLEDFYPVGITGRIERVEPDGTIQVRTLNRVTIDDVSYENGILDAEASLRPEAEDLTSEEKTILFEKIRSLYLQFVQSFPGGVLARGYILNWKNLNEMTCAARNLATLSWKEKYAILAEDSDRKRYELVENYVHELIAMDQVSNDLQDKEQDNNEKKYREAALRKQLERIQRELDELNPDGVSDLRKFELALEESGMNETARKEAEKVLKRMKQDGPDGHEYGMLYDYMEFITGLSWKKEEFQDIDLKKAEKILDQDHYGLKKVKDRIIQQLAVMALNKKQSGSILLFSGAPGTGKTSIGQSIASALGRKYIRISLGGIRDEAEIRGHRRTYVGALPGRIMEGMKRAGVSNPVVVLDEVDKLSRDHSGDPASALLEVLDPEQNNNFTDHYLNVPYDLSDVLFICTANSESTIPEPLLNRMEVIRFPGYTAIEKYHIARKHLLPKSRENMGIAEEKLKVTEKALHRIIDEYTMESGVRSLKREIDTLCRLAAVKIVKEGKAISIGAKSIPSYLGKAPISHNHKLKETQPGIVTGLAWTAAGGEVLFVETGLVKGSGKLILTGQLGDVMKESAQIALTLVRGMFPEACEKLKESDLHIHVPEGAVPKDGPSAGITMVTALSSLVLDRPVSTDYAMTGEVSLRGGVLPIGGLNEKLMAAQRAGITKVLIPYENERDLDDIAGEVKDKLEIIPVKRIKDVLKILLP